MIRSRKSFAIPAIICTYVVALAAIPHPAAAQDRTYAVEPVAITGDPAPGTGGLSFSVVYFADLNDSGLVAVDGGLTPVGSYDEGIWVGSPRNMSLIVRAGDPVPGAAALTFFQFSGGALANASGDVAVKATCKVDGVLAPCSGLWTGSAGNLQLLALTGDPAPGTGGYSFGQNFAIASFDDLGVTSFNADFLTPEGQKSGVWTGTPGSLEPIVVPGDPAPDTVGLTFVEAGGLTSKTGTTVIAAATDDPTVDRPWGYWKTGAGGLSIIAKAGDEAPGTGGRTFGNLTAGASGSGGAGWPPTDRPDVGDITGPILNQLGHVAFNGFLDPIDPLTGYGDEGIWIQDDLGLRLAVMVGDPAPGTTGLQFVDFNHVNFNSLGQIAFDAALNSADPGTDHGIWRGLPDNLTLVVREGDPAPGTTGETFKYLTYGPSMNDTGEVVFQAKLAESGDEGVWVARADGLVELVVRDGEVLKANAGDYRTIQWAGIGDGVPSSYSAYNKLNEAGQLVVVVGFTDGTEGVVLATPIDTTTNLPPVANAGPDLSSPEGHSIIIDGSGCFDPEETILTFVWSVGGVEVATGPQYDAGALPGGTHTVTLTVTDRGGASASDDMILTITPNFAPVANAGPDQTVSHVETVYLDGTASFDPEGGALTYVWSLDGTQIATGATATVGPFAVGDHIVTLTVTDDIGKSATDSMIVSVVNGVPVASAGPDRYILTLQSVWLDGSASSDPEGEVLSYVWTLDGVQIATGPKPTVGPFDAGVYTVTLTVTDGHGASASDETIVTVSNRAPLANAGPDQTADHAQTVTLAGSGSDPEGGPLTYAWSIGGVQIATGPDPTAGPFKVGVHTVTLTVTDDHGATATDSMVLTVVNEAPVANAGPDQTVGVKGKTTTVTLDGSASSDPEGGALSYNWTLDGQTVGTGALLQVDVSTGIHTFTLTVTDDHGATASDTVVVTAVRGNV